MEAPVNANYAAVVVRVHKLEVLPGLDNLVGMPLFGFQALVPKDTQLDALGIVFTAETQLSDEYCHHNDLFRHNDKNKDQSKTGYMEDNRRVRAIRLRKHTSSALFMPLESLDYTGFNYHNLQEGDTFDRLDGKEICRKYVVRQTEGRGGNKNQQQKKVSRVDAAVFPEVHDTLQLLREIERLDPEASVVVTQKLHGTSWRGGRVPVTRKLSIIERIARRFGLKVQDMESDVIFGSHHVVKDANNPDLQHFYSSDIWTEYGKAIEDRIPEGIVLYGELIGWTPDGGAIQRGYTYNVEPGKAELYIYRVKHISSTGFTTDLTYDQMVEFCSNLALRTVPELWRGKLKDFNPDTWIDDKKYYELGMGSRLEYGYNCCVPLCAASPCDEGVVIRFDGLYPKYFKLKQPKFFEHETVQLDMGEENIEDAA